MGTQADELPWPLLNLWLQRSKLQRTAHTYGWVQYHPPKQSQWCFDWFDPCAEIHARWYPCPLYAFPCKPRLPCWKCGSHSLKKKSPCFLISCSTFIVSLALNSTWNWDHAEVVLTPQSYPALLTETDTSWQQLKLALEKHHPGKWDQVMAPSTGQRSTSPFAMPCVIRSSVPPSSLTSSFQGAPTLSTTLPKKHTRGLLLSIAQSLVVSNDFCDNHEAFCWEVVCWIHLVSPGKYAEWALI